MLDEDERVEMTYNGERQRLWFRGDFDPLQATNVTGGDLSGFGSSGSKSAGCSAPRARTSTTVCPRSGQR